MKKLIRKHEPTEDRLVFAKNLRIFRVMRNLSQEELAIDADMSRSYISGIERGIRNISLDNMSVLAKTLEVKLSDLLDKDLFEKTEKR